ncbi:MAG TPA: helix-turn-helix domain-containing protein [Trueperaceae bacterium]|nr:helix-turn-helix domain-containing protein [Trueperaceae bacterium]
MAPTTKRMTSKQRPLTITAPVAERAAIREVVETVRGVSTGRGRKVRLKLNGCELPMPKSLLELIVRAGDELAAGESVVVASDDELLTTTQAAELLNLSRPSVVNICDSGRLPYQLAGKHRRLRLADVLEFRDRREAAWWDRFGELIRDTEVASGYDSEFNAWPTD